METDNKLIEDLISNDPNKKTKDLIIEKIENGQTFKDACVLAGISETTGHRLKALRGEEKERLETLIKKVDLSKEEKIELKQLQEEKILCESFESRVEAGIIKYKEKLITTLNIGSLKDYRAALAILKARFPAEWNVVKRIEHSGGIETNTKEIAELLQQVYSGNGSKKTKICPDAS
jgi:hypothetical protein